MLNAITYKDKAKAIFHVILNADSIVQHVIQNKNGIIKHVNKKDYSWNPSIRICQNSKYLKSLTDTSVTKCDETVIVMNNLSTKKTNTWKQILQVLLQ